MDRINIADAVNDCAYILSFLDTAFIFPQRQQIELSYEAYNGLSLILSDISKRLFTAADALSIKQTRMEV